MTFGSNINNRKLFTGEARSTTRSIDMKRFSERQGARSIDEVRMSRMKLKDSLNTNIYGPNQMRKLNNKQQSPSPKVNSKQHMSTNERQFNHVEAMRNIKRGL